MPGARYGSALIVGHTVHTGGGVFDGGTYLSNTVVTAAPLSSGA